MCCMKVEEDPDERKGLSLIDMHMLIWFEGVSRPVSKVWLLKCRVCCPPDSFMFVVVVYNM